MQQHPQSVGNLSASPADTAERSFVTQGAHRPYSFTVLFCFASPCIASVEALQAHHRKCQRTNQYHQERRAADAPLYHMRGGGQHSCLQCFCWCECHCLTLSPREERRVGIFILLQLAILTLIQLKTQNHDKPSPGCVIADNPSACLERTGVIFVHFEKAWVENNHFQLIHCICYLLPQKTCLACSEGGKSSVPTVSRCKWWGRGGGGMCLHLERCNPTRQRQKAKGHQQQMGSSLLEFVTKCCEAALKHPIKTGEWFVFFSAVVSGSLEIQTRGPESALSLWSPPPWCFTDNQLSN